MLGTPTPSITFGAHAVAVVYESFGDFTVEFDTDVSLCAFAGVTGKAGPGTGADGSNINISSYPGGGPNTVWVEVFNAAGAELDEDFFIAVTCSFPLRRPTTEGLRTRSMSSRCGPAFPGRTLSGVMRRSWAGRSAKVAKLGAKVGGAYASTAARKVFASTERRVELDTRRELKTAEAVAAELGQMKGALMKLGQMASYLDDGLPEPMRMALAQLRSSAPPMSSELAADVIRQELGGAPGDVFIEWDPEPIAAASIGQVHRAIALDPETGDEVSVAVKVQYPGVDEAITADLKNAGMLGTILKQGFGGLDPDEMVAEIKERLVEELDYEREARNQQEFADYYRDHPFVHVPDVFPTYSTRRVLTTELVNGATWDEMLTWDQSERDQAGETIFRFVFRSLYLMRAFNGDPHPGNYLFHGDGRVTFLDFGLVKHFTPDEMDTFASMVKAAAVDDDAATFRSILENAGMLQPGAPVTTEAVGDYFRRFYEPVRVDAEMTWSGEYASGIVRHTFDRTSPIAQFATVPRAFVFIQRINLGLYALLGDLAATGNYRRIAEELWPFVHACPSTAIGQAEADWLAANPRP